MTYLADYFNALTSTELAEIRTALRRLSPTQVLGQDVSGVTLAADTNENNGLLVNVAANFFQAGDLLLYRSLWTVTNGANTKTVRHKIGSSTFQSQAQTTVATIALDGLLGIRTTASQIAGISGGQGWGYTSGSAVQTFSVDTTQATTLSITGQKATGSDTMRMDIGTIVLLRAPT